ncbi:UvrD-helicase domain-containing protein [Desulfovibrio sp. SGI.082]|uniref:UvrD-helicase domain-containing protein n=2 Tax=Desulfovibrio TaxID=872 RepID=UPI003CFCE3E7
MYAIITESALFAIISSIFQKLTPPFSDSKEILYKKEDVFDVVYTKNDLNGCSYILINIDELKKLSEDVSRDIFIRLARALRATAQVPVRLPSTWSEYHSGSFISFFATPMNIGSSRWIAEIKSSYRSLFFYQITTGTKIILEDFVAPTVPEGSRAILDKIVSTNNISKTTKTEANIVPQLDFQSLGSAAISKEKSFESWMQNLTSEQYRAINDYANQSVNIVGPAGSGKTLTLCLKAISDSRKLAAAGSQEKILFVTHSWAMAERIDETLRILDFNNAQNIEVWPLLELLREALGKDKIGTLDVLGIDSSDGKAQQFSILESIVLDFIKDKSKIKKINSIHKLSENIKNILDNINIEPSIYHEFLENIYLEITGGLAAEGILPSNITKIAKYIKGEDRSELLPPFNTQGDRLFIFEIYKKFILSLQDLNCITTDQLVSDAISLMETFVWSAKRSTEGYKSIFIDELQYFNAQERFAITLLGSDTSETVFTTAEDPRQGIFSSISSNWNENKLVKRDSHTAIELKESHRFSEKIIEFIKFIYAQFPLNSIPLSYQKEGRGLEQPILYTSGSQAKAIEEAVKLVEKFHTMDSPQKRLAIICIGKSAVDDIIKELKQISTTVIQSFDDVEKLNYTRKSITIGEWRYLGGMQFTHVILLWPSGSIATSPFANIAELTALYVAASRASESLDIVLSGKIHSVLQKAIDESYVTQKYII